MTDFQWGCCIGALTASLISNGLDLLPISKITKYNAAIQQCEATLPRDVKCVITAVPEVKK